MAIEPVPEMRKALQMKPDEVAKLNKGACELIDAPYLWYCALVTELLQLFLLRSQDATTGNCVLHGLLGIHVDDGICGGDATFLSKIKHLRQNFLSDPKRFQRLRSRELKLANNRTKAST